MDFSDLAEINEAIIHALQTYQIRQDDSIVAYIEKLMIERFVMIQMMNIDEELKILVS